MTLVVLATVLSVIGSFVLVRLAQRGFDYSHAELGSDLARMGRFSWLGLCYAFNWRRYTWTQYQQIRQAKVQQEDQARRDRDRLLRDVA